MKLLSLVLVECRSWPDGEERWKRWSRQVCDAVLGLLTTGRLRLDSRDSQKALHQLLLHSLAPCVFEPVDPLLRVLFSPPPHVVSYLYSKSIVSKHNHYSLNITRALIVHVFVILGKLSTICDSMVRNCTSCYVSTSFSRK